MFYKKVEVIFLLLIISLTCSVRAQMCSGPVDLSKGNIISSGSISVSLDGRKIHPQLLKQDGVIYIKADELLGALGFKYNYDRVNKVIKISGVSLPEWRTGYIEENGKMQICLPLLETLSLLEKRYLYSDLNGKDVISIRTDDYADYSPVIYYMQPDPDSSNPKATISSDDSKNNINININNTPSNQQSLTQNQGYSSGGYSSGGGYYGGGLPNVPGYNSPISSVPDLLANCQYNNEVRGYGLRTRLGFFSVYGVEPQPFGTGFPYALGGPVYNNCYPSPYYPPVYSNPCSPGGNW
jgi:hypothetical protein